MLSSPERTRPPRHTVSLPCQVVRDRDFRLVASHVVNLSASGMLVMPAEAVLTGERTLVSFRCPRWGGWIDVSATVARVIHGRRPGEQQRALGLAFEPLDDWSRYVLRDNLRGLPPSPPGVPRSIPDAYRALTGLMRGGLCSARLA